MHADIAEYSLSTLTYSQPVSSPDFTRRDSVSTMCVCGEMG